MKERLLRAARAVRWYVREATGEAKWDEYVDRCRAAGSRAHEPTRVRTTPGRPPRAQPPVPLLLSATLAGLGAGAGGRPTPPTDKRTC